MASGSVHIRGKKIVFALYLPLKLKPLTTSHPNFFRPLTLVFNGRELDYYLFVKVIDYATVWSLFVTLLLTNKTVRRLTCPFDGDCSAGRPYLCAWRARSRCPHTHATCERRIDAKASSDEAVVDVEVDRYIDQNSASNYG